VTKTKEHPPLGDSFRVVESGVFAEGFGVVLVNPRLLDHLCAPARGNLLQAFMSTDLGNRVCAEGAIVPVVGLAHGDYMVGLRDSPPALLGDARKTSSGWVLRNDDDALLLSGLGYLADWDPMHPTHRRIVVPSGHYAVSFSGGLTVDAEPRFRSEGGGRAGRARW
jgi:hypothetical protein